jgi:ribosome-binding protein aMBF1 (putative translation factor)
MRAAASQAAQAPGPLGGSTTARAAARRSAYQRFVCDPAAKAEPEVDPNVMASRTRTQRDPKREDLRRLGERIREQRRTKGMTQENLAHSLDLSVAYVSLIERGGRNPPYTTVLAIARALGVIPSRIVTED